MVVSEGHPSDQRQFRNSTQRHRWTLLERDESDLLIIERRCKTFTTLARYAEHDEACIATRICWPLCLESILLGGVEALHHTGGIVLDQGHLMSIFSRSSHG